MPKDEKNLSPVPVGKRTAALNHLLKKLYEAGISYEIAKFVVNDYVDVTKLERETAYAALEDVYKRI